MEDKRSETGWLSSSAIKTLQQAGGCGEPARNKKTVTAPGDLSPKLYTGTFRCFIPLSKNI